MRHSLWFARLTPFKEIWNWQLFHWLIVRNVWRDEYAIVKTEEYCRGVEEIREWIHNGYWWSYRSASKANEEKDHETQWLVRKNIQVVLVAGKQGGMGGCLGELSKNKEAKKSKIKKPDDEHQMWPDLPKGVLYMHSFQTHFSSPGI